MSPTALAQFVDLGMRFVCRSPEHFAWVHQLEVLPSDIDCTHMDDAEFDAFVEAQQAAA